MAVACDTLYINSKNMDRNQSRYNQPYFQGQQQYQFFGNSHMYQQTPNPQYVLHSQHFYQSVPPPNLVPPANYYSSQGSDNVFHVDLNMPFASNEGWNGRKQDRSMDKEGMNEQIPQVTDTGKDVTDSVDDYLQSYLEGDFDEEHAEPSQQEAKNSARKNTKFGKGTSFQKQKDNMEGKDPYYSNHRGSRGKGRQDVSRSNNENWRSSSARNKNDEGTKVQEKGFSEGIQEKIRERKREEKSKTKTDSKGNQEINVDAEDRHGESQQYHNDRYTDVARPNERQYYNNKRGQRYSKGGQPYQGRSYHSRHKDYDPQNELIHSNEFGQGRNRKDNKNSNSCSGAESKEERKLVDLRKLSDQNNRSSSDFISHGPDTSTGGGAHGMKGQGKYNMPRNFQGSRGQNRRPFMLRTLSGKVDESQRAVLIEQLANNSYECMVCCEIVRCQNAVWSCSNCYHVFHLRCVKKWARTSAVTMEGEGGGWRCPACQNICDKFPYQYRCFCGKVRDPEFHRMETPHSCGEVCGKQRADNCQHPCNILCHPGPCPPCNAVIKRTCDCGKTSKTMKCSAAQIIKCEEKCGKQLNCGKHFCNVTCHAGSCSMCEEIIVQECYKGHKKRKVVCGSKESFQTSYSCEDPCQKILGCGNHTCEEVCHEGPCKECSLSPSQVSTCPCGATSLDALDSIPRTSCLDPIPTCKRVCRKTLKCGPQDAKHTCERICHEGPCGVCDGNTLLRCRCGAIEKEFSCSEAQNITEDNPFCCDKRCNKKRLCGRHKCGQLCCVLEKEDHLCDFICGKKLTCGLHKCEDLCHRGNCQPCLLASFEELKCHCGTEVHYPPVPCGTRPPECFKKCTRAHACDHPVRHNCHSDENCPPCTELTSKYCMGNHELRKNIPCHINNITCGLPCGKPLPCGQHKCLKMCHKGECQEEGEECIQPCVTQRSSCGHPCAVSCHPGRDCPPVPCKAEITIKCPCGMKSARQHCLAGGSSPAELAEFQKIAVQALASSVGTGQSVDMSNLTSVAKKTAKRQLECDGECAIVERNRRLALALEIKNPDLSSKLGSPPYSDFLKEYTKNNPHHMASIEKAYSQLVQNAKASKHPHRSHQFPPMNRDQRRVIHELADFYGCETQSYDFEPKKNVVATAHRDKCWLPSVTLTALVQRELHPKAPTPIPHVHDAEALRKSAAAAKQSTCLLPGQSKPSAWGKRETTSAATKKAEKHIDYFDFSEG